MSKGTSIRAFDYVNHPYEQVRAALAGDARRLFRSATTSAAARARTVASQLRVDVAGIEVATDITIAVEKIEEREESAGPVPEIRLHLTWEAANSPHLFPFMRAELAAYPLTSTETQLDLSGNYQPPLGALGRALDAAVGHRIAEASVHRFITEVANHLRTTLV
ncbi:MAG TPA: hypothetical protein VGK20_13305 [Candidatus Binatia bacterium]|jgi:hypothetical protein